MNFVSDVPLPNKVLLAGAIYSMDYSCQNGQSLNKNTMKKRETEFSKLLAGCLLIIGCVLATGAEWSQPGSPFHQALDYLTNQILSRGAN